VLGEDSELYGCKIKVRVQGGELCFGPIPMVVLKNQFRRELKVRVFGEEVCVGPIPKVVVGPNGYGVD